MTSFVHPALKAGNVAVITGASRGGIGYAIAHTLIQKHSFKVHLVDKVSLKDTAAALKEAGVGADQFALHEVDVTKSEEVFRLAEEVYEKEGRVDFLALNAGVSVPSKDFGEGGDLASWHKTFDVNFFGVLNGTQAFVDRMVKQDTPGLVVVTGSKQGITQPPGNPAYNASKSAVKSLAESLAHSLLPTKLSAHLLVPGWTWTKLAGNPTLDKEKPAAAWTSGQVADELFGRLDEFYVVCPDNDVSWELDQARMAWNAGDVLEKRPALSRWHPEYADKFAAFVEDRLGASKK